jgi:thiol-disulfide isomerase/thioredoxin
MKKSLTTTISFILFCFAIQTNAQAVKSDSYVINGTINGVDSGVVHMVSQNMSVIDSATIVNGKFTFRGKISSPERKTFMIIPGNWAFAGIVDDSAITFNIDTSFAMHQYVKTKDYPIILQIKETGSPIADVYAKYHDETGFTQCLYLFKKMKTAGKDSLAYLTNKRDSIANLIPEKEKVWINKYIHENPSSLAGIYIFNEYYNSYEFQTSLGDKSGMYLRSVLNQFSGAAKTSSYYESLSKKLSILQNIQPGEPAPDFTLQKRDKSKFTLSTTRGSIVMLDFWASWCAPCRASIPHWKEVYAKYHDKGFNIISISSDRKWSDWTRALDEEKMPWTQVIDKFYPKTVTQVISDLYSINTIPHFVLLDRNGKIIISSGDEETVTKKIEEILN